MNNPNDAPIDTVILARWNEKQAFIPAQVTLIDGRRVWGVWTSSRIITRKMNLPIDWTHIVGRSQSLDVVYGGKV